MEMWKQHGVPVNGWSDRKKTQLRVVVPRKQIRLPNSIVRIVFKIDNAKYFLNLIHDVSLARKGK
jgi:hypothetical protein